MPELPEVELTAQHLQQNLEGAKILRAEVLRGADRFLPNGQAGRLAGRVVSGVYRAGKVLYIGLEGGGLVRSHMAMSGLWSSLQSPWSYDYVEAKREAGDMTHARVVLYTDRGEMVYLDQRLFGRMELIESLGGNLPYRIVHREYIETDRGLARPIERDLLWTMIKTYGIRPLRTFLCDQGEIPGIGNIYSAEIMHLSNLHPMTSCATLDWRDFESLYIAIVQVLTEAIDRKLDYTWLSVYRREFCWGCMEESVKTMKIDERTVYFCPLCQV